MPLTIWNCVLSYTNKRIIPVKTGLLFQEIKVIKKFPGSNFLLPSFLTCGKWDLQVSDLLLATVNFKPCYTLHSGEFLFQEGYARLGRFHSYITAQVVTSYSNNLISHKKFLISTAKRNKEI